MLNRLIRRSRQSLSTDASSFLAKDRLGSPKPSCVSIQDLSFSGEDKKGLRSNRYYGQKLERTHSEHRFQSIKAGTTHFNRQSRLPHWMNSNWGLRTRKPVDVVKHPSLYLDYREDRWRTKNRSKGMSNHHGDQGEAPGNGSLVARFWDYCESRRRTIVAGFWEKRDNRRRTKNRSKGMPSYHGDQREAPGHESLLLSPNNTLTFPTVAETLEQEQAKARDLPSRPPQSNARSRRIRPIAPMNGRLRKGETTYERDLVTTIGSFFSRATSRVMGRLRSRKLNSEGQPIRGKLKKVRSRFSIEADSGNENSTPFIETPPKYSHIVVPPPGLLADSLHSRSRPHETSPRNRLKKRSDVVGPSPTSSLRLSAADPLKEEFISCQPGYRYMVSPTRSLDLLRPASSSPSLLSPNDTPSNSPSAHALPRRHLELEVDIPEPIDWSGLDDVGSEAGSSPESSFTSGGSTLCDKSQTDSLASVRKDPRTLATRQGSTNSRMSGTTAASVESECMGSHNSITSQEMSLEKTDFPRFSLTTGGPDAPQQPHSEVRTPEWWKTYEEGLEDWYSKDSAHNDPYGKNSQFAHSCLDDATQTGWIGVTA